MTYPEAPNPAGDQPERHLSADENAELLYTVTTMGQLVELNETNEPVLSRTETALRASQDLLTTLKVMNKQMAILGTDGDTWYLVSENDYDSLDLRDHPAGKWTVTGPQFKAEITRGEPDYPDGPKHSVKVSAAELTSGQIADTPSEEHIAAAVLYAHTKVLEARQEQDAYRQRTGSRLGRLINRRA